MCERVPFLRSADMDVVMAKGTLILIAPSDLQVLIIRRSMAAATTPGIGEEGENQYGALLGLRPSLALLLSLSPPSSNYSALLQMAAFAYALTQPLASSTMTPFKYYP